MASTLLKTASTAMLLSLAGRVQAANVTSGEMSLLTYNVAGLPGVIQGNNGTGDKETNSKLMGAKFNEFGFDVVNVQEDFNYHAAIYETNAHPYRTATSGGVPVGSGLNTLSNFPFMGFSRTKWDQCSNTDSADCLTPKGFTHMRVQISPTDDNNTASFVDVYNLHSDAGVTAEDVQARQSNMHQVLDFANIWSVGHAVIIFGDTNSRYSREGDTAIRDYLDAGYTDAWIQGAMGNIVNTEELMCTNPQSLGNSTCETVDKVFYRSSPLLTLNATSFNYVGEWFRDAAGHVLSDHNPVAVDMTWTAGTKLQQSGYWGGDFGDHFTDVPTLSGLESKPVVANLTLCGGNRLDAVEIQLTDGSTFVHGGVGGDMTTLRMGEGETWDSARLCKGERNGKTRNFFIEATTSLGNKGSAGKETDECATFTAPEGWSIVGFAGRDGAEVDQLSFVYAPK